MLARRIIAVSADKAFGKQIAIALRAAGGTVDSHASLDELGTGDLQAALLVLHLDGDLAGAAPGALQRLAGDTRMIAILPRSNLAAVVDIMQSSERVAGMLVADDFDGRQLSAMATRVLAGDIFGLDKLILWGTQVHSYLVGDYQEKSLCIAQISEFAELMNVRRKYRESIEQCMDEMLMNALYDAPVDEQGRQIFSEIPTKTRISLRVEQKVVVQYACDGRRFAVAVRDAFGTLERSTVLRYLHKCLHNEQQIDRKAGGAGLGLYLMTNSSTEVYFNVLPGVATEAVCTFDLDQPKLQLESFGYFTERIDAAGRLAGGPSRRLPVGHPVERRAPRPAPVPRGLIAFLVAAIAVTLGLVAIAAWPRLFGHTKRTSVVVRTTPPGATIEVEGKNAGVTGADGLVVQDLDVGHAYPIVAELDGFIPERQVLQARPGLEVAIALERLAATLILDTPAQIPGVTVEIDGKSAGTAPLTLTNLTPGATVNVTFKKAGYRDSVARVQVPKAGKELRLIQPLALADDVARVHVTSDPPGAQVVQNGQPLAATVTPADILVEAGKPLRLSLAMSGKVPYEFAQFVPDHGAEIARDAKLADGRAVHVTSTIDGGKASVTGAPHCQQLATPFDCVLPAGTHAIQLALPLGRFTKKVEVAAQPVDVKFELGTVDAAAGKSFQLGGGTTRRAVFEVGPRKLVVVEEGGATHTVTVVVRAGATVIAQ